MNRVRRGIGKLLSTWCIGVLSVLAFGQAGAGINGAIYTTNFDGTTVNGNIYASKDAVYLTGGPQNKNDPGLVPDGVYYFQVTDPSGSVLLSTDDVTCREVQVTGGRITGVPLTAPPVTCTTGFHANGVFNSSNGNTPVQLIPYNDTPNNGGEYKVWVTPIGSYNNCPTGSNVTFGFCDSESKTDNFKVKKPGVAYVTVCKFEDLIGDGTNSGNLIPGWPITATGVDAGNMVNQTVNTQTGGDGCVSFAFTDFTNGVANEDVTFVEGTLGADWVQTFPANNKGYDLILNPGDNETVYFGNFNQNCVPIEKCSENGGLTASKDANAGNKFTWTIDKAVVGPAEIDTSGDAKFTYKVTLTHDDGTGWKVAGTITLSNNSFADITANVTDTIDNGGSCDVTDKQLTVGAGEQATVPYSCTFSDNPGKGTNTVTVTKSHETTTGDPVDNPDPATANYDFAGNIIGGTVEVTDALDDKSPRSFSYTDTSPITYTYDHTFTGDPAGTCTSHKNTAKFTKGATGDASQTVKVCVGADLTVSKTATPAFTRTYNWKIVKNVDKTKVEQAGGTATFNYEVDVNETGFTDSAWQVTGKITVSNPNDWEAITVNVADTIDNGGVCTVTGGTGVSIPASGSKSFDYTCTYAAAPSPLAGTNKATATWDSAAASTPHGSASGTAGADFGTTTPTKVNQKITVTDNFNGTTTTLGTLTATDAAPFASAAYKYAHTVSAPTGGTCKEYDNTATIKETGQTAGAAVTICNTATGALTMGFWQNKNGQGIISGGASTAGVCNSGTWLRQYAPFQDLSATATCAQVATYAYNLIKAANASGSSMNAMLKAQMLATALDVYFSDPALGGNKIGAAIALGGVKIDLTKVCKMIDGSGGTATCSGTYQNVSSAFGGATSLTVLQILAYAASQSNAGGSVWYAQVKATQEMAKNTFDAINNQVAYIAP